MKEKEINRKFNVTTKQLDNEAEEYEKGVWNAPLGKIIMGRPSLANEEVKPITIRLPISKIAAIDKMASDFGDTRSKILRDAVDMYLASTAV
jgi:hypothetical protein